MLLAHASSELPLRAPTQDDPLRVLVSGCLKGWQCGVDGTDYGLGRALPAFLALPQVLVFPFCPEQVGIGTPRSMPDIHGGDGRAVLEGLARVFDEHGVDLTEKMLVGARAMLAEAERQRIELAILTDMSAACGSQVISDGCRLVPVRRFQRGVGIATALLLDAGIPVVSQRDFRTLGRIHAFLDPTFRADPAATDHHQTEWYVGYFRT